MKKTIFLLALASLAMLSCSKDETIDTNNGRSIDFRAAMGTRASSMVFENLNSFLVTAIDEAGANYFTDLEFVKDGSTYFSTPSYHWPAGTLSFYAYSPVSLKGQVTITGGEQGEKVLKDFEPEEEIVSQIDFITAENTGSKADAERGVALEFKHQLSRISIQAKNEGEAYIYKVKGVRIGKPVSKASFNFDATDPTPKWTLDATKHANYTVEYDEAITLNASPASLMDNSGSAMLIPQALTAWTPNDDGKNTKEGAYLSVLVNITTKDDAQVYPEVKGDYGWAAVPISTTWVAGTHYVYTLDFTTGAGKVDPDGGDDAGQDILGDPIKFTVKIDEWADADPQPEVKP